MIDEYDTLTGDLLGMTRHRDHESSIRAAGKVRRFTLREQVTDYAKQMERFGFIDDDLKRVWPETPESSMRKRRTELAQENIIVETGLMRQNRKGSDEKVWVHRNFHPSPPPVQERDTAPKQSKVARLEARLAKATDILTEALPWIEDAAEDFDFLASYSEAGRARLYALKAAARKFIETN